MNHQTTISYKETGKVDVSASDLIYFSQALEKPILYFFPDWAIQKELADNLPPELQILLLQARKLPKKEIKKLTAQVEALVNFTHSLKNKPEE
jgi:transcriptional regulator with XRE-family HTH domain